MYREAERRLSGAWPLAGSGAGGDVSVLVSPPPLTPAFDVGGQKTRVSTVTTDSPIHHRPPFHANSQTDTPRAVNVCVGGVWGGGGIFRYAIVEHV